MRDVLINGIAASVLVPRWLRRAIYRFYGITCEGNVNAGCFMGGRDITLGERSFLNYGCFIDASAPVRIGAHTLVGMQVMLVTSEHHGSRATVARPIVIGEKCWIGARAMVLPGVTICDGCTIGAGAVVVNDCDVPGTYVGVPARLAAS